jgi:CRISPR-associated protein Csb2
MMFALEVEYLTGRAVATERDNRDAAEWPPHPGRLFMALVAAHAEHDPADAAERAALRWLEHQPPPALWASDVGRREVQTAFVPVNDNLGPDVIPRTGFSAGVLTEKAKVLPERRSKQPRSFPSVSPVEPRVVFLWETSDPAEAAAHLPALARLAARVPYLGHSSSLVRVAVCDAPPQPTLRSADDGTLVLRVPTLGRLEELLATHAAGRRPTAGFYCGYLETECPNKEPTPESTFGRPVVFRMDGPTLPLEAAPRLTAAVRDALMSLCPVQPPPEVLSGHDPSGSPSRRDHVAVLPLAFVDHRHADGSIKGFAVVLPRVCTDSDRTTALRALGLLKLITLGRLGAWKLERTVGESALHSLQVLRHYIDPACDWATVTPVVFDRFPKRRDGKDHAALIAVACRRIGLPEPVDVEIGLVSRLLGVPLSRDFVLSRTNPALALRPRWHVALQFDCPVRGPVVLGAGRFVGLGLFRSWSRPDGGGRNLS